MSGRPSDLQVALFNALSAFERAVSSYRKSQDRTTCRKQAKLIREHIATLDDRLAALAPVTPAGGVDWRAMYRFQTAMRFMDNVPKLTRARAYQMADDEMRGLEEQAPSRDQGEWS